MPSYILFAGSNQSPNKGFETIQSVFSSIADAKTWYGDHEITQHFDWGQIVDFSARVIVSEYKYVKQWKDI